MDEQIEKADIDLLEMGMMIEPKEEPDEMQVSGWLNLCLYPFVIQHNNTSTLCGRFVIHFEPTLSATFPNLHLPTISEFCKIPHSLVKH